MSHLEVESNMSVLSSHRAFLVKYKIGEDVDLGLHFDNSEVTLSVALSPDSGTSVCPSLKIVSIINSFKTRPIHFSYLFFLHRL